MSENLWRKDFPILQDERCSYLDNAATSQKPRAVLDAVRSFYENVNSNPLRGLYEWSVAATDALEDARKAVASFIGAKKPEEIIFVRNATEALNLVAWTWGQTFISPGDEIVIAISEHHSNLLPWQEIARQRGAHLVWLECDSDGTYSEEELTSKIGPKTALVAMAQTSNVLGSTNPVKRAAQLAHENGAVIVVDGAQSVPHMPVDVAEIDADFFAFSGHKMLGPMGIGALYGKMELLEKTPPFLRGGEMIEYVTREGATFAPIPHRFEAGTVNAADAAGLHAAIRYLQAVGFDRIRGQEEKLTSRLMAGLAQLEHVTVYGSKDPACHCGIVSFNIEGCHPHDVASLLDLEHICIRAGHHCAQPLMQYMEISSSCRASVYFYNTEEDIDRLLKAAALVREELGYGD